MIDPVYSSIDDYVDVEAHNAFKTCVRGDSRGRRRLRLCVPRRGIIRVFPCSGSLVPVGNTARLVLVQPPLADARPQCGCGNRRGYFGGG